MPEATVPTELATQATFKISTPSGDFEFPGLAFDQKGQITAASILDVLLVAVASPDQATRDQVLAANDIVIRDVGGKMFFPRPKSTDIPQEMNL